MLAGHMDELGFIITYVNKDGFIYFDTIGGHDLSIISGRRVIIQTANGPVKGVTGKRAIHLMDEEDRKKVPKKHEIWIDLGVRSKKEALERVAIGDVATYDHELELFSGSIGTARAFDNKVGAYVVGETLIRLAKEKKKLAAKVVSVATTQEEIGTRGATTAAYAVNPHLALAVDVGHATDHPDCDNRKFGETKLGGGPIICRGANINPKVYERLLKAAKKLKIPYQLDADPRRRARMPGRFRWAAGASPRGSSVFRCAICTRRAKSWTSRMWSAACSFFVEFAKGLEKGDYAHW